MTLSGKRYFLPFLPATLSSPSQTLEGLFELAQRPSICPRLTSCIASELQKNKDTVSAELGTDVQGNCQKHLAQT